MERSVLDADDSFIKGVVNTIKDAGKVYVKDTITDWEFYILLFAVTAFVYIRPQIFYSIDFYNTCFRNIKGWCGRLLTPPRTAFYRWIEWIMNALQVIAIVNYIYNLRLPPPGGDYDYYVSILALFFALIALKYIYVELFFNYHHHLSALGLAMVDGLVIWIICLVLVILFAVRAVQTVQIIWMSFVFQLIILLWDTAMFGWTCYIFRCFYCKIYKCACHFRHHPEEKRKQEMAQQQQFQQNTINSNFNNQNLRDHMS